MYILLQFIIVLIIFLSISYVAWYITEKGKVPEFLDYPPWSCRVCASTWMMAAVYIALGVSFKWWVLLITGIIVTILNAIALKINEKEKTISIEEYGNQ